MVRIASPIQKAGRLRSLTLPPAVSLGKALVGVAGKRADRVGGIGDAPHDSPLFGPHQPPLGYVGFWPDPRVRERQLLGEPTPMAGFRQGDQKLKNPESTQKRRSLRWTSRREAVARAWWRTDKRFCDSRAPSVGAQR